MRGAGVGGIAGVDRATVLSSSSSSMAIASSLDLPAVPLSFPLDGPGPDTRFCLRGGSDTPNVGMEGVVACAEDEPALGPDRPVCDCCGKFKASCTLIILLISRVSFSYMSAHSSDRGLLKTHDFAALRSCPCRWRIRSELSMIRLESLSKCSKGSLLAFWTCRGVMVEFTAEWAWYTDSLC